mgnify:CR=1 FL=1
MATVMQRGAPRFELPSRELWAEYKKRPTIRARNLIIEAYLPLLRTLAAGVKKGLPAQVELEELVSAGCFGLIDAIKKFDPKRNVQFGTYCSRRVRGSMIDALRKMDLPRRQVREHEAMVAEVCNSFRVQFGRPPCDDEVLERLRAHGNKAGRILRDSRVARVGSLSESAASHGQRPITMEETLADRRRPTSLSQAELRDMKQFALRNLTRTERLVIELYYSDNLTMREIGLALGLSESRISQLRGVVMAKLQSRVRAIRRAEQIGRAHV